MSKKTSKSTQHQWAAPDVDRHVGTMMRERRILLGITQQEMAKLIGVTYQQTHKYERGINRISSGRLFIIAGVLDVDVGYFFEGLNDNQHALGPSSRKRLCLEFARSFAQIENEEHQDAVGKLTRALASGSKCEK